MKQKYFSLFLNLNYIVTTYMGNVHGLRGEDFMRFMDIVLDLPVTVGIVRNNWCVLIQISLNYPNLQL